MKSAWLIDSLNASDSAESHWHQGILTAVADKTMKVKQETTGVQIVKYVESNTGIRGERLLKVVMVKERFPWKHRLWTGVKESQFPTKSCTEEAVHYNDGSNRSDFSLQFILSAYGF